MLIDVAEAEHRVIHRDPFSYCAHPHITALPDGSWLLVFNRAPRRPFILHPPQDPLFRNVTCRSTDEGRTWTTPVEAPDFDWHGVECAGLTALTNGTVLLNQWRFRWLPIETARRLAGTLDLVFPERLAAGLQQSLELDGLDAGGVDAERLLPWARGLGGTFVHISADGGRTWDETHAIDTKPFSGGYGMRGAVELSDGTILLPLSDVPSYRTVFVVRSPDSGRSWSEPVGAASIPGKEFEEPALLRLRSGRLIMLLRENVTRWLHQCVSDDGGLTWSAVERTAIDGYPPHLLALPDHRLLCTYGHRAPEYSIRAVVSEDDGQSWQTQRPLRVRGALPNKDLGYPSSLLCNDGRIFTVYYAQDTDGVTAIQGTWWRP
jgi:hypothetical protein